MKRQLCVDIRPRGVRDQCQTMATPRVNPLGWTSSVPSFIGRRIDALWSLPPEKNLTRLLN